MEKKGNQNRGKRKETKETQQKGQMYLYSLSKKKKEV